MIHTHRAGHAFRQRQWANLTFRNLWVRALRNIEHMIPGISKPDKDKDHHRGKAYKRRPCCTTGAGSCCSTA